MRKFGFMVVVGLMALRAFAQDPPVSSGLILNLQADNIDGSNNSTLSDNQEITSWSDIPVGTDNALNNTVTSAGIVSYAALQTAASSSGSLSTQGTPNYVAPLNGAPAALKFTKTNGTVGEGLGFVGTLGTGSGAISTTAFVVGNLTDGALTTTMRSMQYGDVERSNATISPDKQVVANEASSFRFNGASHAFVSGMQTGGVHVATYVLPNGVFANSSFRIDGTNIAQTVAGTAGSVNAVDASVLVGFGTVGTGTATDILSGTLNAILLFNRVLTPTEIADVELYLTTKYVPEPRAFVLLTIASVIAMRRGRTKPLLSARLA